jgi:hypothetical protein
MVLFYVDEDVYRTCHSCQSIFGLWGVRNYGNVANGLGLDGSS